jgi:integrase
MPQPSRRRLSHRAHGPLRELRRKDVDPETGLIKVRRAVIRPRSGPTVKTPRSKAGSRKVFMPEWMVDDLWAHLDGDAWPGPDGLLFSNYRGEQLSYPGRDMWWEQAKAAAGWAGTFHDLRHVVGTLFAYQGATVKGLMARLGHETPGMAMVYQEWAEERDRLSADVRRGSTVIRPPRGRWAGIPIAGWICCRT